MASVHDSPRRQPSRSVLTRSSWTRAANKIRSQVYLIRGIHVLSMVMRTVLQKLASTAAVVAKADRNTIFFSSLPAFVDVSILALLPPQIASMESVSRSSCSGFDNARLTFGPASWLHLRHLSKSRIPQRASCPRAMCMLWTFARHFAPS